MKAYLYIVTENLHLHVRYIYVRTRTSYLLVSVFALCMRCTVMYLLFDLVLTLLLICQHGNDNYDVSHVSWELVTLALWCCAVRTDVVTPFPLLYPCPPLSPSLIFFVCITCSSLVFLPWQLILFVCQWKLFLCYKQHTVHSLDALLFAAIFLWPSANGVIFLTLINTFCGLIISITCEGNVTPPPWC